MIAHINVDGGLASEHFVTSKTLTQTIHEWVSSIPREVIASHEV